MLEYLASICNDIQFTADANISADCQGFVYERKQNIAFFKPQPASGLLDTSDLCSNPTTYTWLLCQSRGWLQSIYTCTELPGYRSFCSRTCMAQSTWHLTWHVCYQIPLCVQLQLVAQPMWHMHVTLLRSIVALCADIFQQHHAC